MSDPRRMVCLLTSKPAYDAVADDTAIHVSHNFTYPDHTWCDEWSYLWVEGNAEHLNDGDMIVVEITDVPTRGWSHIPNDIPVPYWRIVTE